MKTLNNIFNYIPTVIRTVQNDDAQLKSWAMQAFRSINLPNLHYVKDVDFINLKNHQVLVPEYINPEKIQAVKVLTEVKSSTNSPLTETSTITVTTTLVGGSGDITMTDTNTTTTVKDNLLIDSTLFDALNDSSVFIPLEKVQRVAEQYFCKVESASTFLYSMNENLLQSNILEGTLAIEFYREYMENDEYVIPEEPEVLWQYLAAYVKEKHWEERTHMKEQGASNLYQSSKLEKAEYMKSVRRKLLHKNINIRVHKNLMYGDPTNMLTRIHQANINSYHNRG